MVEIKKPSIKRHHFASSFLNNTQYDDVFKKILVKWRRIQTF